MEYLVICLVALAGSILTFFSGFGLGTLLVPVFALFFPIEMAIALTAVVHFLNNLFKFFLVGKAADRGLVVRFGIPAILSSFVGAYLLIALSGMPALFEYEAFGKTFTVSPVKLTIAVLLMLFALFDIIPGLTKLSFDRKYQFIGGILTGFFGGLSGNQGALRTAFLSRANLTKEAFIATGVVLAILVDIARLTLYSGEIIKLSPTFDLTLIVSATLSAFLGAFIGSKLLKKVTIDILRTIIAVTLLVFSVLLGSGII
jgi:uncharacterized membrane protein YfcA